MSIKDSNNISTIDNMNEKDSSHNIFNKMEKDFNSYLGNSIFKLVLLRVSILKIGWDNPSREYSKKKKKKKIILL